MRISDWSSDVCSSDLLRKRAMGRKIVKALGGEARGKTVALLGLTFKPNTDDMRDAPSLAIVQALEDAGARIVAYDPEGMAVAAPLLPGVSMAKDRKSTRLNSSH